MGQLVCKICGGRLRTEEGEFGEEIMRCWNCGRSPDELPITPQEVIMIMKGTTKLGRKSLNGDTH